MNGLSEKKLREYRKPDGTIDWGKVAKDQLSIIDNQLSRKKETKKLEELSVFRLASVLSDEVWEIVSRWNWFAKKTVGEQWVRATDSIAANISEGYGRYFFGDYLVFLYYARGSTYEATFWLEKAKHRLLIDAHLYESLRPRFEQVPLELNKVVKIIKSESDKWKGRGRG